VHGIGAVNSLACLSAGNCLAGGSTSGGGRVVSERNGRWGKATALPGRRTEGIASVSCASAGNCAAVAYYQGNHFTFHALAAAERHGRWHTGVDVLRASGLDVYYAWNAEVWCARHGTCTVRGFFEDNPARHDHMFIVSERSGRWGRATVVPGTVGGMRGAVNALWCDGAGNCLAGGYYGGALGNGRALAATLRHGRWSPGVDLLRTSGLYPAGHSWVSSVSCSSIGNCAAGGTYTDGHDMYHLFVASERNGRWGAAVQIPGTANLDARHHPALSSVSCPAAGFCEAGGQYTVAGDSHAFVASERAGRWSTSVIPGTEDHSSVASVVCRSAGNCVADGQFTTGSGRAQPFVASEQTGRWAAATRVPGIGGLANPTVKATIGPLSCTAEGSCTAGGHYGYYSDYDYLSPAAFAVPGTSA
jgi:hypothetical protein